MLKNRKIKIISHNQTHNHTKFQHNQDNNEKMQVWIGGSLKSYTFLVLFWLCVGFLNSCGCSTTKSKTPPQETIFSPLTGTEYGSQPSLTTRDRELVSVLEVRIEPGDLNPRPLIPQSVTLPTLPRAGQQLNQKSIKCSRFENGFLILFVSTIQNIYMYSFDSVGNKYCLKKTFICEAA